jgi:hydrogenase/urease accessory protein HupE
MHCKSFLIGLLALLLALPLAADVVRPALIEISVYTRGEVEIEIRASIEALLTGINGRYSNTKQAPNAEQYDFYREMQSEELLTAFEKFKPQLLQGIDIRLDDESVPLKLNTVEIPEPGYTKVPRISVITLSGKIERDRKQLTWYYPQRFGDHATRVRQVDEANEKWHWSDHQWLKEDIYTEPYPLDEIFTRQSFLSVLKTYVVAGFQHILPLGLDHILFVIGIFLLSSRLKPLLWQVTMFTLAHSITLSLSMLDIFSLPSRVVEPLIALSIAYVAIENIFSPRLHRSRLWLVFGFGLLHGLGFASILSEFGMPVDDFTLALISFNIGIEFGQLFIILVAFYGVAVWFKNQQTYRHVVVIPLSVMISITGLYWFWERLEWVS